MKSILIGIAGGTASGKTSVAKKVSDTFGVSNQVFIIAQDSYYKDLGHLPMEKRHHVNFDHPDSMDTDLLVQHLTSAIKGHTVDIPLYDYKSHTRSKEVIRMAPHKIIILEGILILENARLRDLMDIKVFVDTDDDIRLIRRIQRDIAERGFSLESVIRMYENSVKPMHLQFVEPSKRYADMIIPRGVENTVGVDILMTKIDALLKT